MRGPRASLPVVGVVVVSCLLAIMLGPQVAAAPSPSSDGGYEYVFVTMWGARGSGDGQLYNPWGVTVGDDGNVYVADTGNHRIQKFDRDGSFITKWGEWGDGPGQFYRPYQLLVRGGYIYVSDSYNERVQKLTTEGNVVDVWWPLGRFSGAPYGIAMDATQVLYVVDFGFGGRIRLLDTQGSLVGTWGEPGPGDGQFDFPYDVAVDPGGYVYATDGHPYRVQKFDMDGNFLLSWGRDDPQSVAYGIAINPLGHVLVADGLGDRIQIFDGNGQFLTQWGRTGDGEGEFHYPTDVAVDADGYVYVSDSLNHRIQKFAPRGLGPTATSTLISTPTASTTPTFIPAPTSTSTAISTPSVTASPSPTPTSTPTSDRMLYLPLLAD